jgi:hypothetical protein
MISLIPKPDITNSGLAALRSYTSQGFAAIRACATAGKSIREIEVFGSTWDEDCRLLARLGDWLASDEPCPFRLVEQEGEDVVDELDSVRLDDRIKHWWQIQCETEAQTELESGAVADSSELPEPDPSWARTALERIRARTA